MASLACDPGTSSAAAVRWSKAVAPSERELDHLCEDLGLDPERARLRVVGPTALVVVRVPFVDAKAPIPYTTVPLGLVLGPGRGLLVCPEPLAKVDRVLERLSAAETATSPWRGVVRALELVADDFLAHLEQIDRTTDLLEDRLKESLENREVLDLLRYQKSLVHFTAAIDATVHMLERLQKLPALQASGEELEDVLVEFRQALETSKVQRDVMSEMMDAFASIISNNLNVVMKFLAAVTVVLTFPVTVASFYGMNVALPGARSEHAFAWAVVVSLLVAGAVAAYFRRRRWI